MISEEPDGNKLTIISQIFGRFEKKSILLHSNNNQLHGDET